MALRILSWSLLKSRWVRSEDVKMPTWSPGRSCSDTYFVAASLTIMTSSIFKWTSSKNRARNLCAVGALDSKLSSAGTLEVAVEVASLPEVASDLGFSTEKWEMTCGFPLSKSRKSCCPRSPLGLPFESRTTTRTITKLRSVFSWKVGDVSWLVISACSVCAGGVLSWKAVHGEAHKKPKAIRAGMRDAAPAHLRKIPPKVLMDLASRGNGLAATG